MKTIKNSFILLIILSAFSSCGSSSDNDGATKVDVRGEFFKTYADIAYHSYNDSYSTVKVIKEKITAFNANPTKEGFDAIKKAWLDAREPYGQTEVFRFYDDSPIEKVEGNVNPWPLDESWIDYVYNPQTHKILEEGLVNNTALDVNQTVLKSKHEGNNSESNVTLGYHAIEFLLWGQDLYADKPGQRTFHDYSDNDVLTGDHVYNAKNKNRRREYLALVTDLLLEDLKSVVDAWAEGGAYRKTFLALSEKEKFKRILTGMGKLANGELMGERIREAYNTKDPENEHSCFSDNTHRDIILNAKGIENIYLGVYGTTVTSKGLYHVALEFDETLAEKLKTQFSATAKAAEAIPVPFDNAIVSTEGRAKI